MRAQKTNINLSPGFEDSRTQINVLVNHSCSFLRYQNTSLSDFHKTLSFDLLIQFLNGQFNIGNKLEKANVTEIKKE